MHVLFIIEKYYHGPAFGYTNSIHNLIGSYECTNFGTHECVFIDPENLWTNEAIDNVLLTYDYDLAFISSFDGKNASLETTKKLKGSSKKIAMIWHDSIDLPVGCNTRCFGYRWWEYAQYCTQILLDWGNGEVYPGAYGIMAPQDDRLYNKNTNTEEYDLGFPGRIISMPDREDLFGKISNRGYKMLTGGGRGPGQGNLSNEDYASILKKSKICLHLCHRKPGVGQRKGRTSEIAACGKFMLANFTQEFREKKWDLLLENHDYIHFDMDNILERIDYWLSHDIERQQIANNIYETYQRLYSPVIFWSNVLYLCGV
jgi:hypothetical protein